MTRVYKGKASSPSHHLVTHVSKVELSFFVGTNSRETTPTTLLSFSFPLPQSKSGDKSASASRSKEDYDGDNSGAESDGNDNNNDGSSDEGKKSSVEDDDVEWEK